MENRQPPPSLNYALDSLPKGLVGGYDRKATGQLFGRLNASYKEVLADRAELAKRVGDLEATVAHHAETDARTTGELDRLRAELQQTQDRELAFKEQLDQVKNDLETQLNAELEEFWERERVANEQLEDTRKNLEEQLNAQLEESRQRERALNEQLEHANREHEQLTTQLEETRQREHALNEQLEHANREHEQLTTQLEETRQREHALNEQLEHTRHLEEQLEQLNTQLEQTRQREHALNEQLEQTRAGLEGDLERAKREFAAYEKRELLVTELLESAKKSAERTRAEARVEAELTLKKARRREARLIRKADRLVRGAELDLNRLEAEKDRVAEMANKLRADLSTTLMKTLEQLRDEEEPKDSTPAPRKPRSRAAKGGNGKVPSEGTEVVKRATSPGAHDAPIETAESATVPEIAEGG